MRKFNLEEHLRQKNRPIILTPPEHDYDRASYSVPSIPYFFSPVKEGPEGHLLARSHVIFQESSFHKKPFSRDVLLKNIVRDSEPMRWILSEAMLKLRLKLQQKYNEQDVEAMIFDIHNTHEENHWKVELATQTCTWTVAAQTLLHIYKDIDLKTKLTKKEKKSLLWKTNFTQILQEASANAMTFETSHPDVFLYFLFSLAYRAIFADIVFNDSDPNLNENFIENFLTAIQNSDPIFYREISEISAILLLTGSVEKASLLSTPTVHSFISHSWKKNIMTFVDHPDIFVAFMKRNNQPERINNIIADDEIGLEVDLRRYDARQGNRYKLSRIFDFRPYNQRN